MKRFVLSLSLACSLVATVGCGGSPTPMANANDPQLKPQRIKPGSSDIPAQPPPATARQVIATAVIRPRRRSRGWSAR